MRNLKKVLSLSLALVMLIGMMVVGAGAAKFDDVADGADKQEAVEVMNAIEIILGDEGSTDFRPNDTLTRAEAAVIIAKVHFTPDTVKNMVGNETQFIDVAGEYAWAARYVQACANMKIINGDDATHFAPAREVNGIEFAAMLLRVLKVSVDESDPATWEFNVWQAAHAAKLDTNGVVISTAKLSREDAAQMAFNAITEYSPSGSNGYKVQGSDVVYDDLLTALVAAGMDGSKIELAPAADTLAKTRFGLTPDTDTDKFGRTVKTWTVAGVKDPVYTSSTPVGAAASYNEKKNLAANAFTFDENAKVHVDGADGVAISSVAALNGYTGNGVQVDVYKTGDKVTKVVVVNTILAQITNINETSKKVSLIATAPAGVSLKAVDDKNPCYATLVGMTKGDYVLVTASKGVVASVTEPDVITGPVTAVTSPFPGVTQITVGGVNVTPAKGSVGVTGLTVNATAEQVVYANAAGHAFYATGVSTDAVNAVYVTSFYKGINGFGAADANMFQGVLADGTVITGEHTGDSSSLSPTGESKAYTYTIDAAGKYVLSATETTKTAAGVKALATSGTINATDPKLTNNSLENFYSSDVKFIYINGKQSAISVNVKEGVQALTLSGTTKAYAVLAEDKDENIVVTAIYVQATPETANDNIIYVTAQQAAAPTGSKLDTVAGKKTVYSYKVYLNGEEETIWCTTATAFGTVAGLTYTPVAGLYGYTVDDATGAYIVAPKADTDYLDDATTIEPKGVTYINGVYLVNSGKNEMDLFDATGATVVDLSGKDVTNMAALRIASNEGTNGTTLNVAIVGNAEDKTITTIYVKSAERTVGAGDTVENVAKTDEVTTANNGTTKIDGDVAGTVKVEGTNNTTVTGAVSGTVTVANGAKLILTADASIKKDANVTISSLGSIEIAEGTKMEEAVKLTVQDSETDLKANVPVDVPVFVADSTNLKAGDQSDVADNTVVLTYTRVAGKEVTLTITNTKNGKTYTEKVTNPVGTAGIFYVCLSNPTNGSGSAYPGGNPFEGGGYCTVKITQVQGEGAAAKTVTLSESGFTCPASFED